MLYIIFIGSPKQFLSASFNWIFGFSAANYFIHAISYYIVYRFMTIPAFASYLSTWPTYHPAYPILVIITFYTAFANHIYNLAVNFNRFSVFFLKANYKPFWKRHLRHVLTLCVVVPAIFVWNFPFTGIKNVPINGYGAWIAETHVKFPFWMDKNRNLFGVILFCSCSSLVMNSFVSYSMLKRRYSKNTTQAYTQDSSMLSYSLFIFVAELYSCSQQVGISFRRLDDLGLCNDNESLGSQMITVMSPLRSK